MRAARLFAHAQHLTAQDRIDEALAVFDTLLAQRPPSAGVYLHWALALSEASRLDAAVHAMHQAMALEPDNAVLPMFLGQMLFDHAVYDEARTWCGRSLDLNPHQLRAAALLGLIDLACGDVTTGYQRLQQSQSPSPSLVEQMALWCGVREPPNLSQQTSSIWQSRLLLVVETSLLQYPTAQTLATQLAALEQMHIPAVDRMLTRCMMAVQRCFYRLRYRTQPERRDAWLLYAQAEQAYYLGQVEEAVRGYEQLDADFPARQQIEHHLYDIAAVQGDFRRALTHWRRYLKAEGSSREATGEKALVLGELQIQVGDFASAAASLAQAASMPWRDYRLPYYQGLCHLHAGATRRARRAFAEAVNRLHPDIATLRLDELHRLTLAHSESGIRNAKSGIQN
ncbi:MAG: tetratricopeptide repeat protein [Candidatus Tectomicrobia bacterium]|nr:tetratricopeptide repeat protein [Candidatus Tectomicrobia bacterium]